MSESELDKQIEEAIQELEEHENENETVASDDEQISQSIMNRVDWEKFPFGEFLERLPTTNEKWLDTVNEWMAKLEFPERARARIVYSWLQMRLTTDAYRERRKARAKDPVRKLNIKLQKADQKMKRLEEERRRIMLEHQLALREQKKQAAREAPQAE